MRRDRSLLFIFGLAILSVCGWIISVGLSKRNNRAPLPEILTVNGNLNQLDARATKTKASIEALAKQQNISIEEAELRFASSILQAREQMRFRSGGYSPGVHIIRGGSGVYIDPNEVKAVPAGGVINFNLIHSGKMPDSTIGGSGHRNIYVDPLDIGGSSLDQAKLVKSEPGGTYLNGEGYARTKELRDAERTPNGKSGWTGLTRVFSGHGQLGDVILEESDNRAAGITVLIPQSSINSMVYNFPATIIRLQDADGNTMSDLSWIGNGDRTYSLKTKGIDDASIVQMKQLANQLMVKAR